MEPDGMDQTGRLLSSTTRRGFSGSMLIFPGVLQESLRFDTAQHPLAHQFVQTYFGYGLDMFRSFQVLFLTQLPPYVMDYCGLIWTLLFRCVFRRSIDTCI